MRTLDWRTQRAQLTDDARRLLTILQTTTLLALLAAGFTLATAISGRVLASRRQIGLLRAIGLTPAQVTGVLVAHYLVLAALAAPSGLAAGALIAERAVGRGGRLARRARVRGARRRAAGRLAADRAARRRRGHRAARVARRPPAGPGRARHRPRGESGRASRVAGIARRLHLPVVVGLGAKDAFAQRGRTALTVSSLALAAALVATAMGFEATMDRLGSDSALRAQPYELSVESALPPAQVDRLLERTPEVTAVARIREIVLTARDKTEIHARVLDGPLGAFPYAIPDGRAARAPGEVTLGRGALDALHARVGDDVTLQVAGHPVVIARRRPPRGARRRRPRRGDLARQPPTRRREARRPVLGRPARQGRGPGGGRCGAAARGERADRGRAPDRVAAARGRRHAPGRLRHRRAADLIAALNLLTTLGLAIRERERDYAVLASVGATPRQVRRR